MRTLSRLWYSLRALVWRQRVDAELDEELAFHLERETALYEARGLSRRAARREALRHFGGVQRYREECRDVRRARLLDDVRADVRFAFRLMRRDPGFALNVVLVSALGICACATTFSLISGILLAPLPFARPDRIAGLEIQSTEGRSAAVPLALYERILAGTPVFDAIGIYEPGSGAAMIDGTPERVPGNRVTPAFFRVFDMRPVIGRLYTEEENASGAPVAVLGDAAWRTRFNRDPGVVGRRVTVDGASHTIIGVMPPKFRAHFVNEPMFWRPLSAASGAQRGDVNAVVRLREGVTQTQAELWLASFRSNVAVASPGIAMESRVSGDSLPAVGVLYPITSSIYGTVERPLLVLLGAVLLVLLLVSANVATMFLARAVSRERELGVRRAMGATAGREARQLVTECVTLTICGGILGIVASIWSIGLVRALGERILPRADDIALDWRVLLFAVAAVAFTGAIGGLAPTLSARRRSFGLGLATLSDRATASSALTSSLVVAQIALSVVLLVGAGLLVKGFLKIVPENAGFALDNRATLSVRVPQMATAANRFAGRQFVDAVVERLRAVDGVRDVAAAWVLPFSGMSAMSDITIVGRPSDGTRLRGHRNVVTPNYFDVMGVPLLAGRAFTSADDASAEPVGLVNETAARRWWPGQSPLGKQVTLPLGGGNSSTVRVVGVVRDARLFAQDTRVRPEIVVPMAHSPPAMITFVVRTTVEPRSLRRELQRAVWSVAPTLPVGATDIETMTSGAVQSPRFFSTAMSLFASTAVVLGALAVYGLLAFAVARRRREIGIRIALGAPTAKIGRMILGRAALLGMAGVGIGLVLARALSRYLESLLIETSATDASVFAASAGAVIVLALIAACGPAYRALRTDPVESLKV